MQNCESTAIIIGLVIFIVSVGIGFVTYFKTKHKVYELFRVSIQGCLYYSH